MTASHAPKTALAGSGGRKPPKTTVGTVPPPQEPQRLVIDDFPQTSDARALSPNGRAHWATRRTSRIEVASAVKVAATRQRLRSVVGPVRLRLQYVFPDRRNRDIDNLTTGVTKVVIDSLVRGRWIEADDSAHVLEVKAEAVVEKGRRALVVTVEPAAGEGE